MSTVNKLKCVDERSKDITFGFIENIGIFEYLIPVSIKNLILLYFFETEEFGKHSKKLIISSSSKTKYNDIVRQIDRTCSHSVFGTVLISPDNHPNAIYCWSFKLQLYEPEDFLSWHYFTPSIGIVSETKEIDNNCFDDKEYNYNYYGWETSWKELKCKNKIEIMKSFGNHDKIKSGDIVKMELDLKNKSMKYFYNDKDLGIAFTNIDLNYKYYLGISFTDQDQVQIVDFKITSRYC